MAGNSTKYLWTPERKMDGAKRRTELHLYSFMNECTKVIPIQDYPMKKGKVEREYFIMPLRDTSTTGMQDKPRHKYIPLDRCHLRTDHKYSQSFCSTYFCIRKCKKDNIDNIVLHIKRVS